MCPCHVVTHLNDSQRYQKSSSALDLLAGLVHALDLQQAGQGKPRTSPITSVRRHIKEM